MVTTSTIARLPARFRNARNDLAEWPDTLAKLPAMVKRTYVLIINDHYAGHAPDTANDLKRRLGLPAIEPRDLWGSLPLG